MTHTEDTLIARLPSRPAQPSVLALAKRVLDQNLRIEHGGRYLLWQFGRWCPVNLDDVMRAANRRLKAVAKPQITLNPAWAV